MNSVERLAATEAAFWEHSLLGHAVELNRKRSSTPQESESLIRKEFKETLDELCLGCDRDWIVAHFMMRLEPAFMPMDNWPTFTGWEINRSDTKKSEKGYFNAKALKA